MNEQDLNVGDSHYKAFVGPPDRYDFMGATQFRLLTTLGLRSHHKLLDFGCGSLRSGKLFIPYLDRGNYFGQEPNEWLVSDGIENELGNEILKVKQPSFAHNSDFTVGFDEKFDFIVAQSIFSHTNEALTRKGINSIVQSLAADGLALITLVEGPDYQGDEQWGLSRLHHIPSRKDCQDSQRQRWKVAPPVVVPSIPDLVCDRQKRETPAWPSRQFLPVGGRRSEQ